MKKFLATLLTLTLAFTLCVSAADPIAVWDPGKGEETKRPNDSSLVLKYFNDAEKTVWNIFEAEDAEMLEKARINKDHAGYSGSGCVALTCWKTNPTERPGIKFTVNAVIDGEQEIYIGYNNGHAWAQSADLTVNDGKAQKVYFPTVELNKWPSYGRIPVKVNLKQGTNTITLQYDGKTDYPSSFNVDFIAVSKGSEDDIVKAIKLTIGSKTITKVTKGGDIPVEFDVAPIVKEDRTFVPLRGIFEIVGAEIGWTDSTRTASIKTAKTSVFVTIDHNQALVNNVITALDVAPFLQDGRTLIPLRFISEKLGYKVEWDEATQTVTIVLE